MKAGGEGGFGKSTGGASPTTRGGGGTNCSSTNVGFAAAGFCCNVNTNVDEVVVSFGRDDLEAEDVR